MIPVYPQNTPSSPRKLRIFTNIPFLLGIVLVICDVIAILTAQYVALYSIRIIEIYIWHGSILYIDASSKTLFIALGAMTTMIMWGRGLYTNRTPWWSQVEFIAKTILFSLIMHALIQFSLKIPGSIITLIFIWISTFISIVLVRALVYKIASFCSFWKIPTIIISDTTTAEDMVYAFAADISTGYNVQRIFLRTVDDYSNFDRSILPLVQRDTLICYGEEDHDHFIKNNPDFFYVISIDTFRDSSREHIIKTLNENNIPYSIVPTLSRANLYQMEPKYFFGHDVVMLYVGNSAPRIFGNSISRLIKRAMDITISLILLLLTSPIFIMIALFLKIEGQRGSLFYGGARIGKNAQRFNCWKFRSMDPDSNHLLESYLTQHPDLQADWEKYRKIPNDPRITTKTARMIRKTSLDEIPQLWNILVGDMSLVGPRPILEDEVHYFEGDTLKEYISVRPGLTGLWQVSGRNRTSFKRRVYWDSWYVRNWSLWGDIVILIKTPLVLISRKGAN